MRLSDLHNGESAIIVKVHGHGGFRKRIMEMGFVRGRKVSSILNSPLKDPVKYSIMGYEISLRRSEAAMVEILPESDANEQIKLAGSHENNFSNINLTHSEDNEKPPVYRKNVINISLVGNPNCGKTTLFNALSGKNEHVGNYSGVTVDARTGHFNYKDYHFNITDLPGTYSLSPYSPEERFVRQHIFENMPDLIVNTVVASNIERNLYLTTELIDFNPRLVIALNMYDELLENEAFLDYNQLGGMIGVPIVPTVARNKEGLDKLLDTIIDIFELRNTVARHVHINYGTATEPKITELSKMIRGDKDVPQQFPPRYWAIKLLENDTEAKKLLSKCKNYDHWRAYSKKGAEDIQNQVKEDVETVISDAKYGFIAGALQETYKAGRHETNPRTRYIDRLVTNKWLGFPIFILIMFVMFMTTFFLGNFPKEWIEEGIAQLTSFISGSMQPGPLKDLIIEGIIGGTESILVFLPSILILYAFISFMEDSGYMARAAFIMDKIMHGMGLHGKSFISLLMGFGCNVPAIMSARTIESRSSRMITILINPFMSCSARIPVYLLLAGTFVANIFDAAMVTVSLYLFGILVAVLTAKLLRKTVFKKDETPFVMELPPYRMPTLQATLKHMWEKGRQYLKKIGGIILLASIIIWFLQYYPKNNNVDHIGEVQYEQSYLARVGKFCEPVVKPLGLNWKASVALLSGTAAKEITVSTLGVLYKDENEKTLSNTLAASGDFPLGSALSFMVFTLLYFPCIATVATVASETGRKRWALFSIIYSTTVAWIASFIVYHLAG